MAKKVTKATKAKPVAKKEAEIVKAALKPVTKTPVKQAKKPAAVKKEVKKSMSTKPALKKANIKEVKTVEVKPAKEVTTIECHKPAKVTHVKTSDLPLAVEVETVEPMKVTHVKTSDLPLAVEVETVVLETVKVKESDQDLVNQKAKLLKKEKAAEKAANPVPAVTKKVETSSISFEDIKKVLLKPLPTIVPSFLRK